MKQGFVTGDWVVNVCSRVVSRFEAMTAQGAVVTPVVTRRAKTCNAKSLSRIASRNELDFERAERLQFFLEEREAERMIEERLSGVRGPVAAAVREDLEIAKRQGFWERG